MSVDHIIKVLLDEVYNVLCEIDHFDDIIYFAESIREVCNEPSTWYNQEFDEDKFQRLAQELDDEIRSLPIEYKFLLEIHGVDCA